MKKIGDIMKEIGFNEQGSDAVKKSFIKHLIKTAHYSQVNKAGTNNLTKIEVSADKDEPLQLDLFAHKNIINK